MPTYGTYFSNKSFVENQHFLRFDMETEGLEPILKRLNPTHIISSIRGDFEAQTELHQELAQYSKQSRCKIIFLSSANVFDAFSNYPSYEFDKTLSESIYGKVKIKAENLFLRLPQKQYVIARLPMVFGSQSPRIKELKTFLTQKNAYEVFPNLVMNVTTASKLAQQIHYIINRSKDGIFHLGTYDLVHHDEFIQELSHKLGFVKPLFKKVYTSNQDRFLAVLPKDSLLPKHLQINSYEVIDESVLPLRNYS